MILELNHMFLSYAVPILLWVMVLMVYPYTDEERACGNAAKGAKIVALFAAISGAMLGYRYLDSTLLYGAIPAALWATVIKSQILWRVMVKAG